MPTKSKRGQLSHVPSSGQQGQGKSNLGQNQLKIKAISQHLEVFWIISGSRIKHQQPPTGILNYLFYNLDYYHNHSTTRKYVDWINFPGRKFRNPPTFHPSLSLHTLYLYIFDASAGKQNANYNRKKKLIK